MRVHPSITIESDARSHECEACGESVVYGAEELLLRMA
jgi:hypothetical protein